MRKYLFSSVALLLLTMTSCSNDDNNNETKEPTQAILFSFTNEDFGGDETLTRSAETAKPQIVDLGDCEAEITVENEPAAKTRGILSPANGHYTIRAYQVGALKGEMKGTFSGGTFTPDASTNKKLNLPYGTYDFVAFNDDVTISGNEIQVNRTEVETARMGFATVNITSPTPILVQFTMKHVGCRLRTQFVCQKHIPENITATLEATAANVIPASVAYNPTTKVYTSTNGAMTPEASNSPASTEEKYEASVYGQDYTYTSTSTNYHYFLPTTEVSNLKLSFSAGTVFWNPITAAQKLNIALSMQSNKSYLIKIKLKPNYTYLMSDGTTGHFKDTTFGSGTKTPIAVVLDAGQRMAIALKDANGTGTQFRWCNNPAYYGTQANTHMATYLNDALNSQATSGIDETWDASYTHSNITGEKVKGKRADFPAFKAAADYDPGKAYTGVTPLQWYLPSFSDWKWAFPALGFGDKALVTRAPDQYSWYGYLANIAFSQVGGTAPNGTYWTSSEWKDVAAGTIAMFFERMDWAFSQKYVDYCVRPFVVY